MALVKTTTSSPAFFVGNTLRMSFIIFIPALLLTIGYRLMRSQQRTRTAPRIPSDPEEDSL
ncbi:hypothetical protein CRUP_000150 [Coryphaenoides rupestris]|nr:hypothetical protein CRUP_000150 [Coryphaenoides rupestris]